MKIIGISGKAGAGKDWLADLLARTAGYKKWSFALPMKAMGHGSGFTIEEVDVTKPPHVRQWLQHYGTEEHRDKYRPDFWLRVADYWIKALSDRGMADRLVFPDVRFPNELEWIQSKGGKVVRLWHGGPGVGPHRAYPLSGSLAAVHPSEIALDDDDRFDIEIVNDLEMTETKALRLLVAGGVLEGHEIERDLRSEVLRLPNHRLGRGGRDARSVHDICWFCDEPMETHSDIPCIK